MVSKKSLLENLKQTYCRIQCSKVEGVGVFAIRDIPKGVDPFPVLVKNDWKEFSVEELKGLDPEVLKMIDDFLVVENERVWIPDFGLNGINITFFLNHSENPNVSTLDDGNEGVSFLTAREIKKGEELTSDYQTYDNKWKRE